MATALRGWIRKNKELSVGIPFLIFMVGGSLALSKFTNLRYEAFDRKTRIVRQQIPDGFFLLSVVDEKGRIKVGR
jgi:hypothetical protein